MKFKTFFLPRLHFFKALKCQEPRAIRSTEAFGIACAAQLFIDYFNCLF